MSGFSSLLDQFKLSTRREVLGSASGHSRSPPPPAAAPSSSYSSYDPTHADNNDQKRARPPEDDVDDDDARRRRRRRSRRGVGGGGGEPPPPPRRRLPTVPVRTIYVACPAGVETGGPEALHQLCHVINTGGCRRDSTDATAGGGGGDDAVLRACMLYLRETGGGRVEHVASSSRARPSRYDRYDAPMATSLPGAMETTAGGREGGEENTSVSMDSSAVEGDVDDDDHDDHDDDGSLHSSEMVIWPECWTHLIDSLQPSSRGGGGDHDDEDDRNFGEEGGERPPRQRRRRRRERKYQIAIWWLSVDNNRGMFSPSDFAIRGDVLHLAQSAYAREYVKSHLRNLGGDDRLHDREISGGGGLGGDDGMSNNRRAVLDLTEFVSSHASSSSKSGSRLAVDDVVVECARDVDVAYNPAKGMHYTDQIIRRAVGGRRKVGMVVTSEVVGGVSGSYHGANGESYGVIRFAPIGKGPDGRGRMTGEEVTSLLSRSKVRSPSPFDGKVSPPPNGKTFPSVYPHGSLDGRILVIGIIYGYDCDCDWRRIWQYIDFGPHPGMDRLPREAALAGCIVITNREGAAAHDEDVPLPQEFKFRTFDVEALHALLGDICRGDSAERKGRYGEYVERMKPYVEWILGQEDRMEKCVNMFIDEVVTRRIAGK
ncbi:hypothetical protein ACHAXA_005283 [Cyclostephanos tholiformis]|uniref:Uncharacterized protein n=1 Tax=Cyclostephanos tholiformis TaxID=382380 RepID=A0ABD3RNT6_9STRA